MITNNETKTNETSAGARSLPAGAAIVIPQSIINFCDRLYPPHLGSAYDTQLAQLIAKRLIVEGFPPLTFMASPAFAQIKQGSEPTQPIEKIASKNDRSATIVDSKQVTQIDDPRQSATDPRQTETEPQQPAPTAQQSATHTQQSATEVTPIPSFDAKANLANSPTDMAATPVLRSIEFLPGINFDARRALYFQNEKILAIADLHLGYAWTHRAQGQLMPIAAKDDALNRLQQLLEDYQPKRLLLLGDIVHRALPVPALLDELRGLFSLAENKTELILLAGNHDRQLQKILKTLNRSEALQTEFSAGENLFLHGDQPATQAAARFIIGHEHPAISLGDGVATSRKFPCFLISENVITLPSFSSWSAHTPLNAYEFMSPIARTAKFKTALAILGDRLLPVPIR